MNMNNLVLSSNLVGMVNLLIQSLIEFDTHQFLPDLEFDQSAVQEMRRRSRNVPVEINRAQDG
jgi:hypothetical protein